VGGGASDTLRLAIGLPAPTITTLSPASTTATLGDRARVWTLTVNGTLFDDQAKVVVNGQQVYTEFVSATRLRAVLPDSMQTTQARRTVQVRNTPLLQSNIVNLTVHNPTPVLTGVEPSTIIAGRDTVLTLTGDRFAPDATVRLVFGTTTTILAPSRRDSVIRITIPLPSSRILARGAYSVQVVNRGLALDTTTVGGGADALTLTVNPDALHSVHYENLDTLINAGGNLPQFVVRFRDRVQNLVDNDGAVVYYRDTTGALAGYFPLTRLSLGTYRTTATAFPQSGLFRLWVDTASYGALVVVGANRFDVRPLGDSIATFAGLEATPSLTAGDSIAAFTVMVTDKLGNPTDNSTTQFTLTRTGGSSTATVRATRIGIGRYTVHATSATIAGTYSYNLVGCPTILGQRTVEVVPASAARVDFAGVKEIVLAGAKQSAVQATFRDRFGNITDRLLPEQFAVWYSNSTDATLRADEALTAQETLTQRVNTTTGVPIRGLYQASTSVAFPAEGLYSLAVAGITSTTGTTAFEVVPNVDTRVTVEGLRDTITAGEMLPAFTVRYFDASGNPTDNTVGRVMYTRVGGSSTATIAMMRSQEGVYAVSATRATLSGLYNLSVRGVIAANVVGNKNFSVIGAIATQATFTVTTSPMKAAGADVTIAVTYHDRFGNLTDNIAGVSVRNDEFSYRDTVRLTKKSTGVYSAIKLMPVPGDYRLELDTLRDLENPSINIVLEKERGEFNLSPYWAVRAVFEGVRASIRSNEEQAFTVALFDRNGAETDYIRNVALGQERVNFSGAATGSVVARFLSANNPAAFHILTVNSGPVFTTPGQYTLAVQGVGNYVDDPANPRYTGLRRFTVIQVPPAVAVSISGVRTTLITGEQQNTITLTFRDAQGNLADFTGGLAFSGAENGTLALTKVSTGVYSAAPRIFAIAGAYTLSVPGLTVSGSTTFVVNTPPAVTFTITGIRTPMNAGGQQSALLLTFRDAQGNLTDFTGSLAFSGAASGTIALARQSIGLYRATATTFTTPGAYTLSIAGLTVSGSNTFTVVRGNVVTFQNDQMYVNGNRFFPMGWYSDDPTAPGNVLLPYFHEVVSRYYPGSRYNAAVYSIDSVLASYRRFLSEATGLVIFQVPEAGDNNSLFPDSFWQAVVRDTAIQQHRNFLGWYNADEPENVAYKDQGNNKRTFDRYYTDFAGQTRVPTYPYFKQRYDYIKQHDLNHPVFVTHVNPVLFNNFFQQIPLPEQPNSQTEWPTDLPARWKWNTYNGKFYDVLLIDFYPMNTDNPKPPSKYAYGINYALSGLRDNFYRVTPNTNEGAAMYVGQGAGREFGHRNFDLRELAFTCFNAMYTMQINEPNLNLNRTMNLAGLIFWSYPYSTQHTRDTVTALMNFIRTNRIDSASWGIDRNAAVTALTNLDNNAASWHIFRFMREYNGSYYLFVINTFNRSVVSGEEHDPRTASINLTVNLPWQNAQCEELLLRGSTRSVPLSAGTNSAFSFASPIRFDSMEVKIFRFSPRTGLAAFEGKSASLTSLLPNSGGAQVPSEVVPMLSHLEISPNPASDKFAMNIRLQQAERGRVKIYTALGQEVYCSEERLWAVGENKIELSSVRWASGMYIGKFLGESYHDTIQFQIIH
jgi:hypothetical protein